MLPFHSPPLKREPEGKGPPHKPQTAPGWCRAGLELSPLRGGGWGRPACVRKDDHQRVSRGHKFYYLTLLLVFPIKCTCFPYTHRSYPNFVTRRKLQGFLFQGCTAHLLQPPHPQTRKPGHGGHRASPAPGLWVQWCEGVLVTKSFSPVYSFNSRPATWKTKAKNANCPSLNSLTGVFLLIPPCCYNTLHTHLSDFSHLVLNKSDKTHPQTHRHVGLRAGAIFISASQYLPLKQYIWQSINFSTWRT